MQLIATVRQIDEVCTRLGCRELEVSLLNFAVTDGCTVLATKWANWPDHEPATLYFSSGTRFVDLFSD
jgi:glutamine amidotransferase